MIDNFLTMFISPWDDADSRGWLGNVVFLNADDTTSTAPEPHLWYVDADEGNFFGMATIYMTIYMYMEICVGAPQQEKNNVQIMSAI
jgi:hypothetical protein